MNQFVIKLLRRPYYLIIKLSLLLVLQHLTRVLERAHLYYLDHFLVLPHEFDLGVGLVQAIGETHISHLKDFRLRTAETRSTLLYDIQDIIAGRRELAVAIDAKLCILLEILPGESDVLP